MSKRDDLIQFYRILGELRFAVGGTRTLANAHAGMRWLKRGVYFFMNPGEFRRDTGEGLRVTRVGTHAVSEGANTTLWNRLNQRRARLIFPLVDTSAHRYICYNPVTSFMRTDTNDLSGAISL